MQAGSIKMTNSKGQEILYVSPNRVKTNFRTVKLRGKAQALTSLQAKVPSIYYVSKRTEWVGGLKISFFADLVGGSENFHKCADVIYEWSQSKFSPQQI